MKTGPALAGLMAEPGQQHRAQHGLVAALGQWEALPPVARVIDDFTRYAGGAPLAEAGALAALFGGEGEAARNFVAPLLRGFSTALSEAPFGLVPLRHFTDGVISTLLLAREGDAVLTLMAIDGAGLASRPAATSACFSAGEEWEIVLAGSGRGRLVERQGAKIIAHPIDLTPGHALGRAAEREAMLFDAADGVMLILRLQRREDVMRPKCEIALDDGRLLHQASATPRESRHEVAVALLGRMGRKDAAPLLAEIARDDQHTDSLRWQALRECLGLDTRCGFWALCAIAGAPGDTLAVPAGALRGQLLETYPQLAEVEPCPA